MEFDLTAENYTAQQVNDLLQQHITKETEALREEIKGLKPKEKTSTEEVLEKRTQALAKREKDFSCKEHGIPLEFVDYFSDSADFEKVGLFLKQNQGGYIPSAHKQKSTMTKDTFEKLSYSEKAKLYIENPELIQSIIKTK